MTFRSHRETEVLSLLTSLSWSCPIYKRKGIVLGDILFLTCYEFSTLTIDTFHDSKSLNPNCIFFSVLVCFNLLRFCIRQEIYWTLFFLTWGNVAGEVICVPFGDLHKLFHIVRLFLKTLGIWKGYILKSLLGKNQTERNFLWICKIEHTVF